MNPILRKLAWTIACIALAAAALSGRLDGLGEDYASDALARALFTFALARTLNGVISVAQGTEVAVEPAGVGVSLTVGEVLDPINDLVERFSTVMLVAASSLGLQNILLGIAGWWGVSLFLYAAIAAALLAIWWPRASGSLAERVGIRVLIVAIFLRFAVPVLLIGTDAVFNTFLADEQQAATEVLEVTRDEIEDLTDDELTPDAGEQSLAERLGVMLDNSLRAMNVSDQVGRLSERVSSAVEQIVNLIVLFVLETIVVPVALLWLIVAALKAFGRRLTTTV